MRFYKARFEYLQYLYAIDSRIILTEQMIGIPLRLNELIYFLPIESLDEKDFDENKEIKQKSPGIMIMYNMTTDENLGKCLLSNMFPIPYKALIPIDMTSFDEKTIIIMEKKLEYLKNNIDRIMKAAERVYNQKSKGYKQNYLNATVDFKIIQHKAMEWEKEHYKKHYNRFPDSQFFLTNPYTEGITDYYLMNKNKQVAKISIDNTNQNITEIKSLINTEFAPLECYRNGELACVSITNWFRGRGIPSWRDGLDDLLDNLGVKNKDCLLNKAYGLSLSDQYWMNPVEMSLDWNDINFFDNDFNSRDFIEATFENKVLDTKHVDFFSPNNTSDGMLKKAWIVEQGKRYLLKCSFKQKALEPFNEVLAVMVCRAIGLHYVPYTIEIRNKMALSKCECFINKDTELISAYAILKYYGIDYNGEYENIFEKYIEVLEDNGIDHPLEKIQKMFILDYIIVNQDRHLGNFGVIRNVETLEWVDIAPNFDSGQSMYSQSEIYEMNFERVSGCFFGKKDVDFELILDRIIKDMRFEIDFDKLEEIPEKWKKELIYYQYVSMISDEMIDCLIQGLYTRIHKLKEKLKQ